MNPFLELISEHFVLVLALIAILTAILAMLSFRFSFRSFGQYGKQKWAIVKGMLALILAIGATFVCFGVTQGLMEVGPANWAMRGMVGETAPALSWTPLYSHSASSESSEATPVEASEAMPIGELAEHRGSVVVVNFWATWCPPCREEMPDLDRLQRDLADRGLVVLHISDEKAETVSAYLENNPMSTIHGTVDEIPWPIGGRPTTFLVARDGVIAETLLGARSYESFERMLLPLLEDAG